MKPEVNVPFFFQAEFQGRRHSHYGRFLRLEKDRLVEMTWVTGAQGTDGAEPVVTVLLTPSRDDQTRLNLTNSGFTSEARRDQQRDAWSLVLGSHGTALRGAGRARPTRLTRGHGKDDLARRARELARR
jgi:uncharacterized protein YndB with AHSA1/START domain